MLQPSRRLLLPPSSLSRAVTHLSVQDDSDRTKNASRGGYLAADQGLCSLLTPLHHSRVLPFLATSDPLRLDFVHGDSMPVVAVQPGPQNRQVDDGDPTGYAPASHTAVCTTQHRSPRLA